MADDMDIGGGDIGGDAGGDFSADTSSDVVSDFGGDLASDAGSDLGSDVDTDTSADFDSSADSDLGSDVASDEGADLNDADLDSGEDSGMDTDIADDSAVGDDLNTTPETDMGEDLNTTDNGDNLADETTDDIGNPDEVGDDLNGDMPDTAETSEGGVSEIDNGEPTEDISADSGTDLNDEADNGLTSDTNEIPADEVGEDLNDTQSEELTDEPHNLNDGDEVDIPHENEISDTPALNQESDDTVDDITPADIQSDYNALEQEAAEDSVSLDGKFEEQTDASNVSEEFNNTMPNESSTEIEQEALDDSGLESDNNKAEISNVENIQEWLGDINPNYDPFDLTSAYDNNCGSCAFAVEQRLDGNTDIVATSDNIGTPEEMNEATGMEQVSMSPDEIQDYLISQGAGSHGIVGIDRADGPGHWFNAYYDGEKVVAIDGQTGETQDWPPDYGDVTNWDISIRKEKR